MITADTITVEQLRGLYAERRDLSPDEQLAVTAALSPKLSAAARHKAKARCADIINNRRAQVRK